MKFRTLLLGTAAAFAVAGGAQAADLAVAESVEYVKVCDAYGAGYFYIPGSDVCLQISGSAQLRVHFANGVGTNYGDGYSADWDMETQTDLVATAQWMTDWGKAEVFMDLNGIVNDSRGGTTDGKKVVVLDTGWFKIGGLQAGWFGSTFDSGVNTGFIGKGDDFDLDQHNQQIQWSTTIGGMGAFLAVADPRDNHGGSALYTGDMPDILAAVTGSAGAFSWKLSAAVTDTIFGTGWGAQFFGAYTQGGNFLQLQVAASNDAGALYGMGLSPNNLGGTPWHITGAGGLKLSSVFTAVLSAEYRAQGSFNEWAVAAEGDWQIAKGVITGLAIRFDDPNNAGSVTSAEWRTKASF